LGIEGFTLKKGPWAKGACLLNLESLFLVSRGVALEMGLDIYDIQYSCSELTIYIFNPRTLTATIDECVKFNRVIMTYLDDSDYAVVSISSPGVDRSLTRKEHFEMYSDSKISVDLKRNIDIFGKKRIIGTLRGFRDNLLLMDVKNKRLEVSMEDVDTVRPV
jgi:ribosome maturation factor RimP